MSSKIIRCPKCGTETVISTRENKDRGRYCRGCGTKIADAINPVEISKETIKEACKTVMNTIGDQTVEGEELFNKLNHKHQLRQAQTMSIVGGLMAGGLVFSPRPGLFKKSYPSKKKEITEPLKVRTCLRTGCPNYGKPFCEFSGAQRDMTCDYIRGKPIKEEDWL